MFCIFASHPPATDSLELRLTIFSVKTMQMRDILIVPSMGWGGEGLLGLTIIFCKIEDVSEQAYRILTVADNSPAAKAGLRAEVDFVLGTLHGRFDTLEDLRDHAVQHVDKEWLLTVYDSELDVVREVALIPTPTWWPGHEGGVGILGCEFACGLVHRLPFVVPSSEELEKRVKASMPNRSPAISVYVDPLSPNSTPGSSPAPPSFFSPPRVIDLSSPPAPAAVVASQAPLQAADAHSSAAAASSTPAPHATPRVDAPAKQSPVASVPAPAVSNLADPSRDVSDVSDAIKAVDFTAVSSPGRPVLKAAVVERSADAPIDDDERLQPAVADVARQAVDAQLVVDEKQLFQDVKAVLSPKQFKTFTANMKRLNGGSQTGDVTWSNVSEMLGEQPLLQQQLQSFIKQVCRPRCLRSPSRL
jgi:hypothetical protein